MLYVGSGSQTEVPRLARHVRSTLKSRRCQAAPTCPKSANSKLTRRGKSPPMVSPPMRASTVYSGSPAFRRPSFNSFKCDCLRRPILADIVKAGSISSRRAAASRASASRSRWAKADARQQ
jgi:hypothetical protein